MAFRSGCRIGLLLSVVVASSLVPIAAYSADKVTKRLTKEDLEGFWQVTDVKTNGWIGELLAPRSFNAITKSAIWVRKDSSSFFITGALAYPQVVPRALSIEGTESPYHLNFENPTGEVLRCLGDLKDDVLTLCHSLHGVNQPRPAVMVAVKGETVLIKLKLLERSDFAIVNKKDKGDATDIQGLWQTISVEVGGRWIDLASLKQRFTGDEDDYARQRKSYLFINRSCFVLSSEEGLRIEHTHIESRGGKRVIELNHSGSGTTMELIHSEDGLVLQRLPKGAGASKLQKVDANEAGR